MAELIYSILFFIVAIGVLITFHEYGHFWVARRMGVGVLRFSVGFGPVLWRYTPKNSLTEYAISTIPLGGYVRMLDENVDDVPCGLENRRVQSSAAVQTICHRRGRTFG